MRGLLHQPMDPEQRRLNRGHRHLVKRRWDDLIERHVKGMRERKEPWQPATLDRTNWAAMAEGFVQRVLLRRIASEVVGGRVFADPDAS